MAKRAAAPVKKKDNRVVHYLREVRAEVQKINWPSRENTVNLTSIVLGVTVAMSIAMGLLDWIFTKLFALVIG